VRVARPLPPGEEIEVNVGADCGECGDTGWVPDFENPVPDGHPLRRARGPMFFVKQCPWCPGKRFE
jgi:hypothetical protein